MCITTPPPTGGAQKMSDEGEEVRYSDRDPARTRRGSDDRGRGKRPPIRQREREREREIQNLPLFLSLFSSSFKKLVGKSALLALLATSSLPKNHPHFLLAFLFYQLIRKNALCVQQKTSSELTTFPSLSLSLSITIRSTTLET